MFDAFLLRSTLLVLIGYTAVWTLLTVFRVKSPRLHRTAWFAVLLLGCCGAGFNVEIPLPVSATLRHPRAGGDLEGKRAIPLHNAQFKRIAQILITPQEAVQTVLIPSSLGPRLRGDDGHDFKLAQMIGVVWLLGIAFVFLRWTYRYAAFRKILKSSSPAPDDWLAEWHAVGGQRIPMLVADVAGPALVRNFFGYVLVVPPEYWLNIKPVLRASVLRHEFAHYRRRDALKSLLVRLLALPQWFNPCAWSAVKRFDDAAEWACDEAACGGSDDAVAEFAEALVALHESLQRLPRRSRLFSGFASRVPSARIRRLVLVHHHQTLKDSLMKKTTVLTVCVLLLLGGFFQFRLVAQSDQKSADQSRGPAG